MNITDELKDRLIGLLDMQLEDHFDAMKSTPEDEDFAADDIELAESLLLALEGLGWDTSHDRETLAAWIAGTGN